MSCTWLAEIQDAKKSPSAHHRTNVSGYIFATKARIDNRRKILDSNISFTCPRNMANFGPTVEIGSNVWGTQQISTGFASGLRYCSDVAHQRPTKLCTMFAVSWAGKLYNIHFRGLLPREEILPRAKFTLRSSFAFSYIASIIARHFGSGRQPNFAAWYKEWNYRTFAESATYVRLGGHLSLIHI